MDILEEIIGPSIACYMALYVASLTLTGGLNLWAAYTYKQPMQQAPPEFHYNSNEAKPTLTEDITMQLPEVQFKDHAISKLYGSFKWHFAPVGETSGRFNSSVRTTVWSHFSNVFLTEDKKIIRMQFRKMFHPDRGIEALSPHEKNEVFSTFYRVLS